jgi:hypothetical protein
LPTFPAPETVSIDVAHHVVWHFGVHNLGVQPGTFTERLLLTLSAADHATRERLRLAFPEHVALFVLAANAPGGIEWLREIVRPPAPVVALTADDIEWDGVA